MQIKRERKRFLPAVITVAGILAASTAKCKMGRRSLHYKKGVDMTAAKKTPVSIHNKLLEALGKVDRPGDVCVGGDRPLTMPGLQVDGHSTPSTPALVYPK